MSLVEAQPFQGKKKGADGGIDGLKFFGDIPLTPVPLPQGGEGEDRRRDAFPLPIRWGEGGEAG